jgi:hypothetical protein
MLLRDDRRAMGRARTGSARERIFSPSLAFGVSIVGAFSMAAASRYFLPAELIVPVTASFLLALAAALAFAGWHQRQEIISERLTCWDVAGALTFIGIGLSSLIDPEHLMPLVEAMPNASATKPK